MKEDKIIDNTINRFSTDLIKEGLVTQEKLDKAIERSKSNGASLGQVLIKLEYITEKNLISFVCRKVNVISVNLKKYSPDPKTIALLPEKIARYYQVVPLFAVEDTLTIAMSNPLDIFAIDEIREKIHLDIQPVFAGEKEIKETIDWYYGKRDAVQKLSVVNTEQHDSNDPAAKTDVNIVDFLNSLLIRAVDVKASDIHIEPAINESTVRYRIDGMLHKICSFSKDLHGGVISRIKILSELDIAERRKPQDGGFRTIINNRQVDIRVSVFPTTFGENGVLRVLDKEAQPLDLEKIGFSENTLEKYKELITRPHGMILVTGPTGSGKTTTLYATLSYLLSPEKTIVTLEDPVEYELPGIHQSQINPAVGFTFASGLRSLLRQDPNVMMVGEIRDLETANISVQAATTGHLLFSTLHTNDAPGAIVRLLEMGVEPYLIASSVTGVLAQRLMRKLCKSCRIEIKDAKSGEEKFKRGKGCKQCWNTGYFGRTGIYELMIVDEDIVQLIRDKSPIRFDRKMVQTKEIVTLHEDGLSKVKQGLSSYEELYRITEKDKFIKEVNTAEEEEKMVEEKNAQNESKRSEFDKRGRG